MNSKIIIGHRGFFSKAPENTRLGFNLAYLFNFDGVELDIHQTKDLQLVINHDEQTGRTANYNLKIKNSTLKELKKLNFAAHWPKWKKLKKEQILTLDEFLDYFLPKFKVINIELKTYKEDYPNIEQNLVNILRKYNLDKIIVSSFNFNSLQKLYSINPKIKLGFLWWKASIFRQNKPEEIAKVCSYLHPKINLWKNAKEQQKYLKFKLPILVWTIKTKKDYHYLINDPNVKGVITNYQF